MLVLSLAGFTPCTYEDSSDCYWDASVQGNGVGTSFVDVAGHAFWFGEKD